MQKLFVGGAVFVFEKKKQRQILRHKRPYTENIIFNEISWNTSKNALYRTRQSLLNIIQSM